MTPILSNSSDKTETRPVILVLFIYFFICYPLAQITLKDSPGFYPYWQQVFFVTILSLLFYSGKLNLSKVGIKNINKKFLFLGIALGILPILFVIFTDMIIVKTGMLENALFSGAELRRQDIHFLSDVFLGGFLGPVICQLFFTGYLMKVIFRDHAMSIPGNGILFSILNFNMGMGYLGLGMVSASLARLTGSLIPAIFFGMGCSLAKVLILTSYPRITTILVFLI